MSKKLLFVFNPYSGKGLIKNSLVEILDIMVKAGFEVTVYTTQCQGDAIQKVAKEAKNFDRVVCSGGDGTLDEVVTGMIQSGANVPIGYIPAGSTNDFANSLEIPKDMVMSAEVAIHGTPFACDMGYFNGDTFVYVAAFGLFTAISYTTPQELKNVLGHAAYIIEGAKSLHDIQSYHLDVRYNGIHIQDEFIYGMITNSVSVGGFKGMTGPDVKLDDGVFEVTLIRKPKNPFELNEIIRSLTNRIDDTDMIYSFKTDELQIASKEVLSWTLDGEFGGEGQEWIIKNRHKEVCIYVPEDASYLKN